MSRYTSAQIEEIFHACLHAGDADGVETCLRAMVGADPARADQLYDDLKAALRVAPLMSALANIQPATTVRDLNS
jgi:hypothetical protein